MLNLPKHIVAFLHEPKAVGSRVTCSPPPLDTDQDWLAYCCLENSPDAIQFALVADGWAKGGSFPSDLQRRASRTSTFISYRKGENNLIVTSDLSFYRRFLAATSVAKRLNLMHKEDRIALFQAVLYGNSCES